MCHVRKVDRSTLDHATAGRALLSIPLSIPKIRMTTKPVAPAEFVYRCPDCHGVGAPFHIETKRGAVTVHFNCQREWKTGRPDVPLK